MSVGSLGIYRPQRNWGTRVREVTYKGMQLIELENESLRIGVLAGKGTDVIEFNFKPQDLDFAWLTAGGVRNTAGNLPSNPGPIDTFTDTFPGCWQEIFPNGGLPSTYDGARFGQHAEVSHLPWDVSITADSEKEVAITFSIRTLKSPYLVEKTMRLVAGDPTLYVEETITNESPLTVRAMWGHHIAYGRPFLDETTRIRVPDGMTFFAHPGSQERRVVEGGRWSWPIADGMHGGKVDLSKLPPSGEKSEMMYLEGFRDEAWYEVHHPGRQTSFRVEWDPKVMPYLWYWMEFEGDTGYPWYGRHYNVGLEPFSSWSPGGLAPAVENGTALTFGPREQKSFWLRCRVVAP